MIELNELVEKIRACTEQKSRILVAIAGPPGSGKSTFAKALIADLGPSAVVLPMDGFHLDNKELERLGLLDRKGAPETFDAEGFVSLLREIRGDVDLSYPTFDRDTDKTVPDGGHIDGNSKIIVVEGNYLLLDTPPWTKLAAFFDLTIYLDVARSTLTARLIERWQDQGLTGSEVRARAYGNDLRNADYVAKNLRPPDFTFKHSG